MVGRYDASHCPPCGQCGTGTGTTGTGTGTGICPDYTPADGIEYQNDFNTAIGSGWSSDAFTTWSLSANRLRAVTTLGPGQFPVFERTFSNLGDLDGRVIQIDVEVFDPSQDAISGIYFNAIAVSPRVIFGAYWSNGTYFLVIDSASFTIPIAPANGDKITIRLQYLGIEQQTSVCVYVNEVLVHSQTGFVIEEETTYNYGVFSNVIGGAGEVGIWDNISVEVSH